MGNARSVNEAQVLRIISHVNGRRKLRTLSLTLINPVANPNIHKLKTTTLRSAQTFQLQLVQVFYSN